MTTEQEEVRDELEKIWGKADKNGFFVVNMGIALIIVNVLLFIAYTLLYPIRTLKGDFYSLKKCGNIASLEGDYSFKDYLFAIIFVALSVITLFITHPIASIKTFKHLQYMHF